MPVDVFPIDTLNQLGRPDHHLREMSEAGDPQYTLTKAHCHAVAIIPTTEVKPVKNAAAQLSMFSSEERPVSPSASQDSEKDWTIRVATSCLRILPLLTAIAPHGWFGRTSPACYPVTEETILPPSFEGWGNSGMGSPTEFLTLSTSEFPSAGVACSLSDILETGDVPQRFFLSATACRGILRRAEKRGKELPKQLQQALEQVAQTTIQKN